MSLSNVQANEYSEILSIQTSVLVERHLKMNDTRVYDKMQRKKRLLRLVFSVICSV